MLDDVLLGNYKTVSQQLGLAIEGGVSQGHLRITGSVDGVPLRMWFGAHATHTKAELRVPAPFELRVENRGLFGRIARMFSSGSAIGDAAFEKKFSVRSPDRQRVAQVLSPEARATLLEIAGEKLHPDVDQQSVHIRMFSNGGMDNPAKIERLLRETARLAKTIESSFAQATP